MTDIDIYQDSSLCKLPTDTIIGVIGNGFVGNTITNASKNYFDRVMSYDIDPQKCNSNLVDLVNFCDIINICVPTPNNTDMQNDVHIENTFCKIKEILHKYPRNQAPLIILRSTVLPGVTRKMRNNIKLFSGACRRIFFVPEFLSRATAQHDVEHPTRVIIGTETSSETFENRSPETNAILKYLLSLATSPWLNASVPLQDQVFITSYEAAELSKYMSNCLGAIKVSFMNEMYQLSKHMGCTPNEWESAVCAMLASGWVSKQHTNVPGPDGRLGFGGPCLAKDLFALQKKLDQVNLPSNTIAGALATNKIVRQPIHEKKQQGPGTSISNKESSISASSQQGGSVPF